MVIREVAIYNRCLELWILPSRPRVIGLEHEPAIHVPAGKGAEI